MGIIEVFLEMAIGHFVWIDIPSAPIPLEGKVEAFDEDHVLLSCENGLFCVAIDEIANIDMQKQVEIVAGNSPAGNMLI